MSENNRDVRWLQRLRNYRKALGQLKKFVVKEELSELEEQGLIKAFEYTYELAWNTLKDFLEYQGYVEIYGSRDTIRKAYEVKLISDGETWMDMLASRNRTSHTYNEDVAEQICRAVKDEYYSLFCELEQKLSRLEADLQ